MPPNLILSFKNRIIIVSIFSISNNNKSERNVFIRYQEIVWSINLKIISQYNTIGDYKEITILVTYR